MSQSWSQKPQITNFFYDYYLATPQWVAVTHASHIHFTMVLQWHDFQLVRWHGFQGNRNRVIWHGFRHDALKNVMWTTRGPGRKSDPCGMVLNAVKRCPTILPSAKAIRLCSSDYSHLAENLEMGLPKKYLCYMESTGKLLLPEKDDQSWRLSCTAITVGHSPF